MVKSAGSIKDKNNTMEKTRVIIDETDGLYSIYEEGGLAVEVDFKTIEEAEKFAMDNDMEVVLYFSTR